MERVHKKDLTMYNQKNSNVATIRGAFGRLTMHTCILAMSSLAVLMIAINDICKQTIDKGSYDNHAILIYAIILFVIAAAITITRAIMLKDPNIYFVGNEMYIKENKDYYLKISPQEIDEYGWKPLSAQNTAGIYRTSRGYASCSYCGYLNLVVNGIKYTVSCCSLKKAKHYIDGMINGLSVKENNFDGDPLRALYFRIYSATSIVTCTVAAFCYLMLNAVNEAFAAIFIILFSAAALTGIILMITFFVKFKNIKQMEGKYFEDFVIKQPVALKSLEENDNIQSDERNNGDNY